MKGITNDVYGQNMQRKDAEPKIRRRFFRGFRRGNQVEQQVMGKEHPNSLVQANEDLHKLQRPTQQVKRDG